MLSKASSDLGRSVNPLEGASDYRRSRNFLSGAAAGEWSRCVWVHIIAFTHVTDGTEDRIDMRFVIWARIYYCGIASIPN